MTHTPSSITHWSCQARLEKYGSKALCCECSGHECPKEDTLTTLLSRLEERLKQNDGVQE